MILQIWLPWDLKTEGKYLEGKVVPFFARLKKIEKTFLADWKLRKHKKYKRTENSWNTLKMEWAQVFSGTES